MLADTHKTDINLEAFFETAGKVPKKQIIELYNFSRALVTTNTLDILLENIVRHVVDIIQVPFCRLLILTSDNKYTCQGAYFRQNGDKRKKILDPLSSQRLFNRVARLNSTLVINRNQDSLSIDEGRALRLHQAENLCIVPLRVSTDIIGILIMGDDTGIPGQPFHDGKLRLAKLIADQSASAIHRANLSSYVKHSHLETVMALAKTIEARDSSTGDHGKTVVNLAEKIANKLGCSIAETQTIGLAALLHDIGKIGVPDEILRKPSPLNQDEWKIMQKHPEIGAEIVFSVSNLSEVASMIRSHHEKYDGSGYPSGLKGNWISLGARILALVDAYDAIISERIYRPKRSHSEALAEIFKCSGTHFDPDVVNAFQFVI